ncbi:MAG: head GIN domain-containing protein [Putridiphycobacter sp.]|nr:head GIN domain-containing protein [Putridiphycobacter sp.]
MKNFMLLFFMTILATANAGVIKMKLADFSGVEFTGNYTVEMVKSDSNYIVVDNRDDMKVSDSDIEIMVANDILKMYIKQDLYTEKDISVKLYYKALNEVSGRRGVKIEGDTIVGTRVKIFATTGGKIYVGTKAEHVDISIKSGGSVRVKGTTNTATYDVNAGGIIATSFLVAKAVEANIQFGGEIILQATETLAASVKAGGTISYRGNPKLTRNTIKLGGTIEDLDEINKAKE